MLALDLDSRPDVHHDPDLAPVPPATLQEARTLRDALARLIGREREAAADFLLALADFDRRRGWERLGHASLFTFLTRELGLSKGAAFLRFTAARLLPRHPAVEAALRSGRLCLSAVGALARVLTPENEAEVLPRFLGRSAREAREVVAEILPCPAPPVRDVVTLLAPVARLAAAAAPSAHLSLGLSNAQVEAEVGAPAPTPAFAAQVPAPVPAVPGMVLTSEPPSPACAPASAAPATTVEPLTADLRRLHLTVSQRLLDKVAKARDGLSHALPGANAEQVLEAALDLLLERQARAKALVKRPRKGRAGAPPEAPPVAATAASDPGASAPIETLTGVAPAPPGPADDPIPAEVERAVRLRDGDRCQFPLDAGGVCGSTWQVELDHLVPRRLGGPSTVASLRCACSFHNRYAAEQMLGPAQARVRRRK